MASGTRKYVALLSANSPELLILYNKPSFASLFCNMINDRFNTLDRRHCYRFDDNRLNRFLADRRVLLFSRLEIGLISTAR